MGRKNNILSSVVPHLASPILGEESKSSPLRIGGVRGGTKKVHRFGFTLVELIVVITILAILGTIAFVSFGGYTGTARNSARLSDMSNIKNGLEIFAVKSGSYPLPSNSTGVTYSGSTVWYQGIVGDTITNLIGMNKNPTDPLYGSNYSYSVTTAQDQYQIAGVYEGSSIAFRINDFITTANAASSDPVKTYLQGNYNGVFVKYKDATNYVFVTTPSIILSDTSSGALTEIKTMGGYNLAINNTYNVPHTFKNTANQTVTAAQKFDFVPLDSPSTIDSTVVVWRNPSLPSDVTAAATIATSIAAAYSWITISPDQWKTIADIVNTSGGSQTVAVANLLNTTVAAKIDTSQIPQASGVCSFGVWVVGSCGL